jgi:pimeloyl-ACP methyl ester carboxylesterase
MSKPSAAPSDPAPLEHHGCRLAWHLRGQGPPVLFIQGVGVHGDGWLPQIDGLADRYRCLWFDNRGMGKSLPRGVPVRVEQMAEDALALMDAAGWESAHVVGHSLGGLVALHLGLTARERLRSLGLLCTFSRGAVGTKPTARMLWLGLRSRLGPRRARRRAFLEIVMPEAELAGADTEAMAARLAPLFGHDLADQPPIAMEQLAALRAYDATPRLAELAGLPTLVISATHDPIARPAEAGRILAAGIPRARYLEMAHASHGAPIQCAGEVNGMLDEHFRGAEAARGRPA